MLRPRARTQLALTVTDGLISKRSPNTDEAYLSNHTSLVHGAIMARWRSNSLDTVTSVEGHIGSARGRVAHIPKMIWIWCRGSERRVASWPAGVHEGEGGKSSTLGWRIATRNRHKSSHSSGCNFWYKQQLIINIHMFYALVQINVARNESIKVILHLAVAVAHRGHVTGAHYNS